MREAPFMANKLAILEIIFVVREACERMSEVDEEKDVPRKAAVFLS